MNIPKKIEDYLRDNVGPQKVTKETLEKLSFFVDDVIKWQPRLNLVSHSSVSHIWIRHILDSLQLLPHIKKTTRSVLDFGSGGGFPAIPLSILCDINFTLVESITKKCTFLSIASRHAKKRNTILNKRIEEIKKQPYDLITSRAMSSLEIIFDYALPFLNEKTYMLIHKGEKVDAEIKKALTLFDFAYKKHPSITDDEGVILEVSKLRRKDTHHGDASRTK